MILILHRDVAGAAPSGAALLAMHAQKPRQIAPKNESRFAA
jgi:hypothetical protein